MEIGTYLKQALPGVGFLGLGLANWGARCLVDQRTEKIKELAQWRGIQEVPSWLAANHLKAAASLYGLAAKAMIRVARWAGYFFQGWPRGGWIVAFGVGIVLASTARDYWKGRQSGSGSSTLLVQNLSHSPRLGPDSSQLREQSKSSEQREVSFSPLSPLVYGQSVKSRSFHTPVSSSITPAPSVHTPRTPPVRRKSPLVASSGLLMRRSHSFNQDPQLQGLYSLLKKC